MTHALRQNCGSFLYDNIRREWPVQESSGPTPASAGKKARSKKMEDSEEWAHVEADEVPEDAVSLAEQPQPPKEWPLFNMPAISSIRVTGFEVKSETGTVWFSVQTILEGFQWTVQKRYDDFAAVHKTLSEVFGYDKFLLPSKRLLGYFGTPKQNYLEEMRVGLEAMLRGMIQAFHVPPTEVLRFLEYPFVDVLSVTQSLAAFFYEEGELVLLQDKAIQISPLQLHCVNRRLVLPMASSGSGQMKDDFGHLLDFLQHLKKLKLAPPTEEKCTLLATEQLTFDLSIMRKLEILLIDSIDLHLVHGRAILPKQLVALEVRRCLDHLKDLLVVYPSEDVEQDPAPQYPSHRHSSPAPDLGRALRWTALKQVVCKLCDLKKIDESIRLLPVLERLDLSYNCIEVIENLVDLPHLRVVDVSHNKIKSLASLSTKIGNVTKLGLASNQISSLDGIQKVKSLQYLDLCSNSISEVSEVGYLSHLPCLDELFLRGNPVAQAPSYRFQVFGHLPSTAELVSLDGKKASRDELEITASMLTPKGHKRVLSRTAHIKPDIDETETREAEGELEVAQSVTNQLEKLRREGGDRWLAIFNADKAKQKEGGNQEDDLVTRSPKKKRKAHKHHHQHRHQHKGARREGSEEREGSAPPTLGDEEKQEEGGEEEEESISPKLMEAIRARQEEKREARSTTNFPATVMEYHGSFHALSPSDVDQLLVNSPLEECAVSVDSSLRRVLEVIVSAGKTRCQRDLALLQDIRLHEGRRFSVCLQFSTFGSSPTWVIYCVPDVDSLARLYVTLQHSLEGSREGGPETIPLEMITNADTRPEDKSTDEVDHPAHQEQPQSKAPAVSTQPSITLESVPTLLTSEQFVSTDYSIQRPGSKSPVQSLTPTRPRSPVEQTAPQSNTTPPLESRIPFQSGISTPAGSISPAQSGTSTPAGSRSPARPSTPIRSVTPDPETHTAIHPNAVPELKSATKDSLQNLKPPMYSSPQKGIPTTTRSVAPSSATAKPTAARKVVKKPGLDSPALISYFQNSVAQEKNEVVLNVMWGGCSIPSSPHCDVESGLLITDKAVYLLEVLNPEDHPKRQLSWAGEKLPLEVVFYSPLVTLLRITCGIFDQSILIEFIEKGVVKSFALFPRTYEQMIGLTENLKASLDASSISHQVTTTQDMILNPPSADSVLFLNPDSSDLQSLKDSLVIPKTLTQVSNFLMSCKTQEIGVSIDEEVRRITEDSSAKFEIVRYMMVDEVSHELLPIANGRPHLRSRVLVLTNEMLYLCNEEIVPRDEGNVIKRPFSRCSVIDAHPISEVTEIKVCDRAHPLISYSDPAYEFMFSFEATEKLSSAGSRTQWKLCIHDRQYIDQFFTCLRQLWQDVRQSQLSIAHTAELISSEPTSPDTKRSSATTFQFGSPKRNPTFFTSEVLIGFASLTNYQRLNHFKKRVAQAEFMKFNEIPVSVFLAHCSVAMPDYTEIEVCVVASNYAVYLLSDLDNIQRWVDRNGPTSFSRMSLLSKKDVSYTRCFYRLWLSELKEVRAGLFHLSVQLTEGKTDTTISIHTQNLSATLSLLNALLSNVNLRNTKEEEVMSELLSDYIDLASDSFSEKVIKTKKSVRPNVEFIQPSSSDLDKLKHMLLGISPSITRNTSIEQCAATIRILYSQVMLMVEEMRIRDSMTVMMNPHLVLLTNYGLYLCVNANDEHHSPSVCAPSDLKVKKWCHIDLVDRIEITSPSVSENGAAHVMNIYLRSQKTASGSDVGTLCLAVQNAALLRSFLYSLSLLWHERSGRNLPVHRL